MRRYSEGFTFIMFNFDIYIAPRFYQPVKKLMMASETLLSNSYPNSVYRVDSEHDTRGQLQQLNPKSSYRVFFLKFYVWVT